MPYKLIEEGQLFDYLDFWQGNLGRTVLRFIPVLSLVPYRLFSCFVLQENNLRKALIPFIGVKIVTSEQELSAGGPILAAL